MCTLIIDTSTKKSLVVFAEGAHVLLNLSLPIGYQSSSHLMTSIELGFKELKISPAELTAVSVGVGPGSFTGTRVGVAAAKGLAFPRALPLIGFCSLESFVSKKEGRFASVIDARMGGFYVLIQEKTEGEISPVNSPELVPQEMLDEFLRECECVCTPENSDPDPFHLATLTQKKLKEGRNQDLNLIYLRTSPYQRDAIQS